MKAVFLDRNTLSSHMELSIPQGVTQWVVYESTSPEQLLSHLAGADIAITNKVRAPRAAPPAQVHTAHCHGNGQYRY